jgi:hypothetical protein
MIRIYYDPQTGEIEKTVTDKIANESGTFILHSEEIRICDYRVDTETKKLVYEPYTATISR